MDLGVNRNKPKWRRKILPWHCLYDCLSVSDSRKACPWLSSEPNLLGMCLAWYKAGLGVKVCLVCVGLLAQSLTISHSPSHSHIHHFLCQPGPMGRIFLPEIDSAYALLFIQTWSTSISDLWLEKQRGTYIHTWPFNCFRQLCFLLQRIMGKTGSIPAV